MTVEELTIVDEIFIDSENFIDNNSDVVLVIYDDLSWDNNNIDYHVDILKKKMNAYFAFINSKNFLTEYPRAEGRSIVYKIIFQYAIPDNKIVEDFLAEITTTLHTVGIKLRLEETNPISK